MSTTQPWWHADNCILREEVVKGTLKGDDFAADLYNVRIAAGPEVYRDPDQFFQRTYPAESLKQTVAEVLQRLSDKPGGQSVIQLQVAYGGGKTHALISLLHLAERTAQVAHNTTVQIFYAAAGLDAKSPPACRVALLPCDKMGVLEGALDIRDPKTGKPKTLRTLWGALAYQLGGEAGLARVLEHENKFTPPGEQLLKEILQMPLAAGEAPLILLDEAANYVTEAVRLNREGKGGAPLSTFETFFQALTQAVSVTPRACLVATLLSHKEEAVDREKREIILSLSSIFNRNNVTREPVTRADYPELLRRRLFESCADGPKRDVVASALLAEASKSAKLRPNQKDNSAHQRFVAAYPFHPDLLDVFFEKWTRVEKFHRTREAIRLLADALRDSYGKDLSPVVGVGAFLNYQDTEELAPTIKELAQKASETQDIWSPQIHSELKKAKEAQAEAKTLSQREIEQAVIAVFLHSQPAPAQRAETPDLYSLLLHPGVDQADLELGLDGWRKRSWFLADEPTVWRLDVDPNLNKMLSEERGRLKGIDVRDEIEKRVKEVTELKQADPGVAVSMIPDSPDKVDDNTDLHYIILHPESTVTTAAIPESVRDFFFKKTGTRQFQNTIIVLAPEKTLMDGLRNQVSDLLAWRAVQKSDSGKKLKTTQLQLLQQNIRTIEDSLRDSVKRAYSILLALDDKGAIQATVLPAAKTLGLIDDRPFPRIKKLLEDDERLVTDGIDTSLLLPEGPFELWGDTESHKKGQALLELFASAPSRPRFLKASLLSDALLKGCSEGTLVLASPYPDGTERHYWRHNPPSGDTLDLFVLPATRATLVTLEPDLLAPGALPNLWPTTDPTIQKRDITRYFDGTQAPKLTDDALNQALVKAVEQGHIAARTAVRTYFKEVVTATLISDSLELAPPPPPLYPGDILPDRLGGAWQLTSTPVQALLADIQTALSAEQGAPVAWPLLKNAVLEARDSNKLTIIGSLTDDPTSANSVTLEVIEATISGGGGGSGSISDSGNRGDDYTPKPPIIAHGIATNEVSLSPFEFEKLGDILSKLTDKAAAGTVSFKVLITVEGKNLDPDLADTLNALLSEATSKLKFEA